MRTARRLEKIGTGGASRVLASAVMLAGALAIVQSMDWSGLASAMLPALSIVMGGSLAIWLFVSSRPSAVRTSQAGPSWRIGPLLCGDGLGEDLSNWILPTALPQTRSMILAVLESGRLILASSKPDLKKKELLYAIQASEAVTALPNRPDIEVIRKIVNHEHPSLSKRRQRID
jgi:hypothetical protein